MPSGVKNFFFILSEITPCFSLDENDLAEEEKLLMQEEKQKICRLTVLIRWDEAGPTHKYRGRS